MTDAIPTRVRRKTYRLAARIPIPDSTSMGRNGLRPDRARWHILDNDGAPICGRLRSWEIVDLADFSGVAAEGGRVCNPCHGEFSWQPAPRGTHREAWEAERGPLPIGWVLHYECRQVDCLELDHMTPMSRADHARLHNDERGRAAGGC